MSFARRKVLGALLGRGVVILREGGGHTIVRGQTGKQSSVPRHSALNRVTVRKIVRQLDLNWPDVEKDLS